MTIKNIKKEMLNIVIFT